MRLYLGVFSRLGYCGFSLAHLGPGSIHMHVTVWGCYLLRQNALFSDVIVPAREDHVPCDPGCLSGIDSLRTLVFCQFPQSITEYILTLHWKVGKSSQAVHYINQQICWWGLWHTRTEQSVEDTGTKGLVSAFKELRGLWRNGGEYNVRDTWKVIRALWVRVNGLSGQMGVVR